MDYELVDNKKKKFKPWRKCRDIHDYNLDSLRNLSQQMFGFEVLMKIIIILDRQQNFHKIKMIICYRSVQRDTVSEGLC